MTYHSNKNNEKRYLDFWTRLYIALYQFRSPIKVAFLIVGLLFSKALLNYLLQSEVLSWLNTPIDTIVGIFGVGKIYFVEHFIALFMAFMVLVVFAKPLDLKHAEKSIRELGIPNSTGDNTPIFILNKRYKFRSKLRQIILIGNGSIENDFKKNDNLRRLGSKMHCFVTSVEPYGKKSDKLRIIYRNVEADNVVNWEDSFLSQNDFELRLGQKVTQDFINANLNESAHILIAGSTGSGKSVLLSSLLMQSLKKGAKVVIAEFSKRGVDWSYWKNLENCTVFTRPKAFSKFFSEEIVKEVDRRADLLEKAGCKNIYQYNTKIENKEIIGEKLNRWIIGFDEAGQVYTPSQDKEREEFLKPIRAALNKLVAEYRFCGVHLMIATQIPSSQIFSYEIRYLTDLKMCGVSTELLSDMAIDSKEAAAIKQKGQFCTNNGETFRGFLFREADTLKEFKKD